ncbi:FtsX-like permease family protein [Thioalkalivibrio sp. AKL17]|uniref:ABC transporter permease n=1 Tax=Thioalkalivibrio sp. AKL17 TaxID=1158160 RepID=UPI00036D5555|nr:FtsX-like permease family protein [Thioalkalivibrio sp. AKL17]
MRTLHLKVLRDLARLRGQAAAIALVIASGVLTLVFSVMGHDALSLTQERFYAERHFADVFAEVNRAPRRIADPLREIPGVAEVEPRVRAPARLELDGFDDPIRGQVLSLPDGRQPALNQLHLREGRLPERARSDEVVVSDGFAEAHGLVAGDTLRLIIGGRLVEVRVSGIALSPEFVYQVSPGHLMPDYERYAILWMNESALAAAWGMEGAFNSLSVSLQRDADRAAVIDALDAALARYGSTGAHGRDELFSHEFVTLEIQQLGIMAVVVPAIFLLVSAFLLHVVMGRIIRGQRDQIAILKAFGYGNLAIAWHYVLLTTLIVLTGSVAGIALGAWTAHALVDLYMEYFRFPELNFRLQGWLVLLAVGVAMVAALLGTLQAVWQAVRMQPAEAMRPPAPERFRRGWLEGSALMRGLGQSSRIILRNLARHRLKALASVIGIGLSGGLLLIGAYQLQAVGHMIDQQYRVTLQMDVDVAFTDPVPPRVAGELRHEPGVLAVETWRSAPVRLHAGARSERIGLLGMDPEPHLRRVPSAQVGETGLPAAGVVLTDYLADQLALEAGDALEIEFLEGRRRSVTTQLAGVVDEPMGTGAYIRRDALHRLKGEGPAVTGAWLLVDSEYEDALYASLSEQPEVASVERVREAEANVREYMEETVLAFAAVFVLLAGSIAFAVTYNNARIAYAERERELATLEVLGYSRAQVSWVLLGEIALVSLAAIPVAWASGTGFAWLLNQALTLEFVRLPFIITPQLYGFAALGIIVASTLSGLLILRRLRGLDRVQALKAAE